MLTNYVPIKFLVTFTPHAVRIPTRRLTLSNLVYRVSRVLTPTQQTTICTFFINFLFVKLQNILKILITNTMTTQNIVSRNNYNK